MNRKHNTYESQYKTLCAELERIVSVLETTMINDEVNVSFPTRLALSVVVAAIRNAIKGEHHGTVGS